MIDDVTKANLELANLRILQIGLEKKYKNLTDEIADHKLIKANLEKELQLRLNIENSLRKANDSLEKSSLANLNLMEDLYTEIKERTKAEKMALRREQEQLLISNISKNLVSFDNINDAYIYIGQQIYAILENAYLILTLYNDDNKSISIKHSFGLEEGIDLIINQLGFDPSKLEVAISDLTANELSLFKSKKIVVFSKNCVYLLSGRNLNRKLSRSIELILGIKSIYTIGFSWENKLYGGISILSKDGQYPANGALIEIIVNQASIAIQRLYAYDAFAENIKLLTDMLDNNPALIYILDIKGRFLALNRQLETVLGKPKAEIIGKSRKELFPEKIAKNPHFSDLEVIRAGNAIAFEDENQESDGLHYYYTTKFPLFDHRDKIYGMSGISTDITNLKLAELKLKSYNEQLRKYAAHNDKIREEERMNLARSIHDILGSSLAGLKMELAVAKQIIFKDFQKISPEFEAQMNYMTIQINDSVGLMRSIVRELRPGILDELGITESIRWQAGETENRSGIKFSLMITPEEFRMNSKQSGIIFRIFQEILTNIVMHSGATHAKVWLRLNDEVFKMKVTDNGIGANTTDLNKADSFGVMGMRERALLLNGKLSINGKNNIGTTVILEVPMK